MKLEALFPGSGEADAVRSRAEQDSDLAALVRFVDTTEQRDGLVFRHGYYKGIQETLKFWEKAAAAGKNDPQVQKHVRFLKALIKKTMDLTGLQNLETLDL